MSIEIERKFLVDEHKLPALGKGKTICQGYIPTQNNSTVRIRIQDEDAFLTIKGPSKGISRSEFEYAIPLAHAKALLEELCSDNTIQKKRYEIPHEGLVWELDIFAGTNAGLIVAEVELESEHQAFNKPSWVGKEVSGDFRYANSSLIDAPYSTW
ncbi:MAG: CYTH domain-containing protein [Pseudohongiellaceae bacterium]|nr:CYTH domain-containing protein [Pseudohongiellaceae bacterium]